MQDIETLVVTHFDSDHWNGLHKLSHWYGAVTGNSKKDINLFYPGFPFRAAKDFRASSMALFLTLSPFRNLSLFQIVDLLNAWKNVCNTVHPRAMFEGDKFTASGHDWLVHWPPRELNTRRKKSIENFLDAVRELAVEMAQNDFPILAEALDIAHIYWRDSPLNLDGTEEKGVKNRTDAEAENRFGWQQHYGHDPDTASRFTDDFSKVTPIPQKYLDRCKELLTKASGIDNYLSLVVSDKNHTFLNLGDIEKGAKRALLQSATLHPEYRLMLAPHHGSHGSTDSDLPKSLLCISQNGSRLSHYFETHRNNHLSSLGHCFQTQVEGSWVIYLPDSDNCVLASSGIGQPAK